MSQSTDKYLRKAQLHIKAGEGVQAEEIYKKILAKFPKNKKAILAYQKLKTPPQVELNNLISLFNNGKFKETVLLGETLTRQFPSAIILHEIVGAANMSLGNADKTIASYQRVLQLNHKHTDAYNNLGMVFYNEGKFSRAVDNYQKAVEIEPNFADAHYNLANALKQTGDLGSAIESYRSSIKINPNDAEVLSHCGNALKDYGEFDQALECYNKALAIDPAQDQIRNNVQEVAKEKAEIDNLISDYGSVIKQGPGSAEISYFTGKLFNARGYSEVALDNFKDAIKAKPDYAEAYQAIALIFKKRGQFADAIKNYKQAVKIKPDYAEAYINFGNALNDHGDFKAAIKSYDQAIKINPDLAEAYNNKGNSLKECGEIDAAIEIYKQAIKIKPERPDFYNNIGNALKNNGDLVAAIKNYKQAIQFNPECAEFYNNIGNAFRDIGELEIGLEYLQKATEIKADYAEAHFNKSLVLLRNHDFRLGWQAYGWRWEAFKGQPGWQYLPSGKPSWNFNQKQKVLVWPEQGIGDEIMFSSIIPDLHVYCPKLIIQIDRRLIPLFKRSFSENIDYWPRYEPMPQYKTVPESKYDAHIPIGSLPRHFRQTSESFKTASKGWLSACNVKTNSLRKKLLSDGSESIIGISWHSKKPRLGAEYKTISLIQLAKKLYKPKVKLVNLQYGDVSGEIEKLKQETGIEVHQAPEVDIKDDLDGLASLIMACDKVVSISNVTIHLAGALGKQAHVLLAFSCDWRWGKNPNSAFWYDSVQLHRQAEINDWESVLKKL